MGTAALVAPVARQCHYTHRSHRCHSFSPFSLFSPAFVAALQQYNSACACNTYTTLTLSLPPHSTLCSASLWQRLPSPVTEYLNLLDVTWSSCSYSSKQYSVSGLTLLILEHHEKHDALVPVFDSFHLLLRYTTTKLVNQQ